MFWYIHTRRQYLLDGVMRVGPLWWNCEQRLEIPSSPLSFFMYTPRMGHVSNQKSATYKPEREPLTELKNATTLRSGNSTLQSYEKIYLCRLSHLVYVILLWQDNHTKTQTKILCESIYMKFLSSQNILMEIKRMAVSDWRCGRVV